MPVAMSYSRSPSTALSLMPRPRLRPDTALSPAPPSSPSPPSPPPPVAAPSPPPAPPAAPAPPRVRLPRGRPRGRRGTLGSRGSRRRSRRRERSRGGRGSDSAPSAPTTRPPSPARLRLRLRLRGSPSGRVRGRPRGRGSDTPPTMYGGGMAAATAAERARLRPRMPASKRSIQYSAKSAIVPSCCTPSPSSSGGKTRPCVARARAVALATAVERHRAARVVEGSGKLHSGASPSPPSSPAGAGCAAFHASRAAADMGCGTPLPCTCSSCSTVCMTGLASWLSPSHRDSNTSSSSSVASATHCASFSGLSVTGGVARRPRSRISAGRGPSTFSQNDGSDTSSLVSPSSTAKVALDRFSPPLRGRPRPRAPAAAAAAAAAAPPAAPPPPPPPPARSPTSAASARASSRAAFPPRCSPAAAASASSSAALAEPSS